MKAGFVSREYTVYGSSSLFYREKFKCDRILTGSQNLDHFFAGRVSTSLEKAGWIYSERDRVIRWNVWDT